jgi:hypothetical protein
MTERAPIVPQNRRRGLRRQLRDVLRHTAMTMPTGGYPVEIEQLRQRLRSYLTEFYDRLLPDEAAEDLRKLRDLLRTKSESQAHSASDHTRRKSATTRKEITMSTAAANRTERLQGPAPSTAAKDNRIESVDDVQAYVEAVQTVQNIQQRIEQLARERQSIPTDEEFQSEVIAGKDILSPAAQREENRRKKAALESALIKAQQRADHERGRAAIEVRRAAIQDRDAILKQINDAATALAEGMEKLFTFNNAISNRCLSSDVSGATPFLNPVLNFATFTMRDCASILREWCAEYSKHKFLQKG